MIGSQVILEFTDRDLHIDRQIGFLRTDRVEFVGVDDDKFTALDPDFFFAQDKDQAALINGKDLHRIVPMRLSGVVAARPFKNINFKRHARSWHDHLMFVIHTCSLWCFLFACIVRRLRL